MNSHVTFLYTNSYDGTADVVVSELGSENVFRFNFDLWSEYEIYIGPEDFEIKNPAGNAVNTKNVAKVYWRKPIQTRTLFPEGTYSPEDMYAEDELWYAARDLINLHWEKGKVVLVEPLAEMRVGKFVQLRAAQGLFEAPAWKFLRGSPRRFTGEKQSVVKSLTLNRIADRAVMYATKVPEHELDPREPWFIQDFVDAAADITIVYVRGKIFAFELERGFTDQSIDWRVVSLDPSFSNWMPHNLPEKIAARVREYMTRLSLDYGRLDLLLTKSGEYMFLEVNPNGEWGWLDPSGENGILPAIVEEVSPDTPLHPIAVRPCFST